MAMTLAPPLLVTRAIGIAATVFGVGAIMVLRAGTVAASLRSRAP